MAFEQKEWKNRLSENPTRRTLTPTDGGTPMVVDVTRNEGTIMQPGDPFNAENMNDLERRIAEGIGGGEELIASVEQEESQNAYAVGDKLVFNGTIYNVISPIAIGNSLVPDVNIKATSVSELVNTLEDEFTANGNRLYFDYKNGKYGMNTDPERGADTFIPFKKADEMIITRVKSVSFSVGSSTYPSGSGSVTADTIAGYHVYAAYLNSTSMSMNGNLQSSQYYSISRSGNVATVSFSAGYSEFRGGTVSASVTFVYLED